MKKIEKLSVLTLAGGVCLVIANLLLLIRQII